jgi:hypothetical protein
LLLTILLFFILFVNFLRVDPYRLNYQSFVLASSVLISIFTYSAFEDAIFRSLFPLLTFLLFYSKIRKD